jgi:Family of unknown function (DUF6977)
MAERPIFLPTPTQDELVKELSVKLTWHSGFAEIQKKRNIQALHEEAARLGYAPLLEVSTKSDDKVGQHLSAFHLKVHSSIGDIPLECAFQGSKVFERGGPYTDLFTVDPRTAKRDPRLRDSGNLIAFEFQGVRFPLEPKTVFYDWLYIGAIFPHREWLSRLSKFVGFTDIEFNPERSINCQARSMALFFSLKSNQLLQEAMKSPETFLQVLREHEYETHPAKSIVQEQLAY